MQNLNLYFNTYLFIFLTSTAQDFLEKQMPKQKMLFTAS